MKNLLTNKFARALSLAFLKPRSAFSWLCRGALAKDPQLISQTYWNSGRLPRTLLRDVFSGIETVEISLPRVLERKFGTSITAEEACQLAAITKFIRPSRVLEIGTYDGNTTLLLAANLAPGGVVTTVDLPPDFQLSTQKTSLTYPDGDINLTPRQSLGIQYKSHPLEARIRQVYGDSASLDWEALGGRFGLIFIDGCHTEAYVRSDTKNALKHLDAGGIIVWHDYGMIPEVSVVVDELDEKDSGLRVHAIIGTRLAVGVKVDRD